MIRRTIEMAASMGIGHKVLFTGFLRGNDVEKVFKMADLYVMPSVSEPFGNAPITRIPATRASVLDVHLDVRPQTAKFHHDGSDVSDANWVNLEKLKLILRQRSGNADAET